jgi:hypothetical protein
VRLLLARCGCASVLVALACGVDDRKPEVASQFARSLQFGVQGTPQVTPLPAGVGTGPQVVALPGETTPTVATPGDDLNFAVGWQGGSIQNVNLSFTANQYFSIPSPNASASASGVVQIPAFLAADVCHDLDAICHPITCNQQVVTAAGVASLVHAVQILLDCAGAGCAEVGMGTKQPGDPCLQTMECIPGSVCFNRYCVGAGRLRISLAFTVDSDFDLHVLTPAGNEIYFASRSFDGGELDVDQCVDTCGTSEHVENVVFGDTVLPGQYEVWVENFTARSAGDFTIQIAGDVTQTFTGSLPMEDDAASEHFTFTF